MVDKSEKPNKLNQTSNNNQQANNQNINSSNTQENSNGQISNLKFINDKNDIEQKSKKAKQLHKIIDNNNELLQKLKEKLNHINNFGSLQVTQTQADEDKTTTGWNEENTKLNNIQLKTTIGKIAEKCFENKIEDHEITDNNSDYYTYNNTLVKASQSSTKNQSSNKVTFNSDLKKILFNSNKTFQRKIKFNNKSTSEPSYVGSNDRFLQAVREARLNSNQLNNSNNQISSNTQENAIQNNNSKPEKQDKKLSDKQDNKQDKDKQTNLAIGITHLVNSNNKRNNDNARIDEVITEESEVNTNNREQSNDSKFDNLAKKKCAVVNTKKCSFKIPYNTPIRLVNPSDDMEEKQSLNQNLVSIDADGRISNTNLSGFNNCSNNSNNLLVIPNSTLKAQITVNNDDITPTNNLNRGKTNKVSNKNLQKFSVSTPTTKQKTAGTTKHASTNLNNNSKVLFKSPEVEDIKEEFVVIKADGNL